MMIRWFGLRWKSNWPRAGDDDEEAVTQTSAGTSAERVTMMTTARMIAAADK
jgi:hypothetical protein